VGAVVFCSALGEFAQLSVFPAEIAFAQNLPISE
jgi:hypothetical protein